MPLNFLFYNTLLILKLHFTTKKLHFTTIGINYLKNNVSILDVINIRAVLTGKYNLSNHK
jgi:hypothetical protein